MSSEKPNPLLKNKLMQPEFIVFLLIGLLAMSCFIPAMIASAVNPDFAGAADTHGYDHH